MKNKLDLRVISYTLAIVFGLMSMVSVSNAQSVANGDDDNVISPDTEIVGGVDSSVSNGEDDGVVSSDQTDDTSSVVGSSTNGDDDQIEPAGSNGVVSPITNGDDDGIISSDIQNGDGSVEVLTVNGEDDGVLVDNNTGDNNSAVLNLTVNGDDDTSAPIVSPNPEENNISPSNSVRVSGRKVGSKNSNKTAVVSPVAVSSTTPSNCVYLKEYMKQGKNNNPVEVKKLQSFLKNVEKLDVIENGIFDNKTLEAVKAFQLKYSKDILSPWGATIASGEAYRSTVKKINEISCKTSISFTTEDKAVMAAFKNAKNNGISQSDEIQMIVDSSDDQSDYELAESVVNEKGNSNVAAASAGAPSKIGKFFSKVFNFLFRK